MVTEKMNNEKHDLTPVQVRWIRKNKTWVAHDVIFPSVKGIFYIVLTFVAIYVIASVLAYVG